MNYEEEIEKLSVPEYLYATINHAIDHDGREYGINDTLVTIESANGRIVEPGEAGEALVRSMTTMRQTLDQVIELLDAVNVPTHDDGRVLTTPQRVDIACAWFERSENNG